MHAGPHLIIDVCACIASKNLTQVLWEEHKGPVLGPQRPILILTLRVSRRFHFY